jgi:hypothetical protein
VSKIRPAILRAAAAAFVALGLAAGSARALVTLNDGTDRIYTSGTFTMGYDSNINASAYDVSDTTMDAVVQLEYLRRAGMIGVNANISYAIDRFLRNTSYDTVDPTYSLEFDKASGRTTGSLDFGATRASQADAAVNLYTTSWDYNASLNIRYPVIDRYSFTGTFAYDYVDYTKTSGQPLVNLTTYNSSLSLFYILSDERDLFVTYRYRDEQCANDTSTVDDALSLGVHGKVLWDINGSLSVGYQILNPRGVPSAGTAPQGQYGDLTANGSVTWNANRELAFTGSLSRDYSTTPIAATTDTTAATLDGKYRFDPALSAGAGIGGGEDRFLGPLGLNPGTGEERLDYYFTWNTSVNYKFNERLNATLAYAFFENWSNLGFAVFRRNTVSLALSSRW